MLQQAHEADMYDKRYSQAFGYPVVERTDNR